MWRIENLQKWLRYPYPPLPRTSASQKSLCLFWVSNCDTKNFTFRFFVFKVYYFPIHVSHKIYPIAIIWPSNNRWTLFKVKRKFFFRVLTVRKTTSKFIGFCFHAALRWIQVLVSQTQCSNDLPFEFRVLNSQILKEF